MAAVVAAGLIEREAELTALGSAVGAAAEGDGRLVIVVGAPGIGKTALLSAVVRQPAISFLLARGGELEREFPYGIVRQLVEPVLRAAGRDQRADLLSGPAAPLGALVGDWSGPPAEGAALDHAFYWFVMACAESRPVALVIDDAHWCDVASLRALLHLARRMRDAPVALLVAMRPDEEVMLQRLRDSADQVIELQGLTTGGVRQLVRSRLLDPEERFSDACAAACGGNPFLLTELLGAVDASGLEPTAANAGRVRSIGPRAVARSVLLRLEGLGVGACSLARALSVLGDGARLDLVARLADVAEPDAVAAADGLRVAHIASEGAPLRFAHSIVRAAVYEDIAPAERTRLHRSAAALLDADGAPADAVASHLLATDPGADGWVVARLVDAATAGVAMSTPEAVAAYVGRALAESAPGVERARLLYLLGGALFQTVAGGAIEPLSEALEIAEDPQLRMEIARALASALMAAGRADECWALVERSIEELAATPEIAARLELYAAQRAFGDPAHAAAELPRIAGWSVNLGGASPLDRSMLAFRAWAAMAEPTGAEECAAYARAALSGGALVTDDTWYVTFELAVWSLIASGCLSEAHEALDAAIAQLDAIGRAQRAATLLPVRAEIRRRRGELALAHEDARIAAEIIPPEQIYAPQTRGIFALVLIDQGELAAARAVIGSDAAPILPFGTPDVLGLARGRLRIEERDLQGGLADIMRHGELAELAHRRNPGYWSWRSLAARALVSLGRRQDAVTLAGEELRLARRTGLPAFEGAPLIALGLAHGGSRGIASLEQAVTVLDGSPLVQEHTRALLELGTALRLAGKRQACRAPLARALETATELGVKPIAERARQELGASGARPRRTALRGIDALTPSEHRVASLAARGLTNRQIAQTLYVTPKTVEAHLRSSYDKLGVAGKGELPAVLAASA